jgi:5'-3' exonuclease
MGIHNLNKFLRTKCPHVFKDIHISEFAYKKVAIDITLFLCKFKAVCGEKWVSAFINLVSSLRRNEIHCVFIFDNGAPIEKTTEKEERRKQQEIIKKKVFDLENALEKFKNTNQIDPILIELYNKLTPSEKPQKRLLGNSSNSIDMNAVENKIKKMKNYILNICEEDFVLARKLFDILNVPYYSAPLEAECACADLCRRGLVDAVLTEDTDVLAYGSPIFLSKIDTSNDTCVQIVYSEVLEALKITSSEFLDLCIMFGCDYNKNINKVGIETSYKYILEFKSIDEIQKKKNLDVSILNHKRTRELFTQYEKLKIESIPFCGSPNFDNLQKLIFDYKLHGLNFSKIKSNFIDSNIKISHGDEEKIKENPVEEEYEEVEVTDDEKENPVEEEEYEEVEVTDDEKENPVEEEEYEEVEVTDDENKENPVDEEEEYEEVEVTDDEKDEKEEYEEVEVTDDEKDEEYEEVEVTDDKKDEEYEEVEVTDDEKDEEYEEVEVTDDENKENENENEKEVGDEYIDFEIIIEEDD